jgi:hypothetical protein
VFDVVEALIVSPSLKWPGALRDRSVLRDPIGPEKIDDSFVMLPESTFFELEMERLSPAIGKAIVRERTIPRHGRCLPRVVIQIQSSQRVRDDHRVPLQSFSCRDMCISHEKPQRCPRTPMLRQNYEGSPHLSVGSNLREENKTVYQSVRRESY